MTPPFVPHLKSNMDTSYFPTDELVDVSDDNADDIPDCTLVYAHVITLLTHFLCLLADEWMTTNSKDVAFINYTYRRFDYLTRRGAL